MKSFILFVLLIAIISCNTSTQNKKERLKSADTTTLSSNQNVDTSNKLVDNDFSFPDITDYPTKVLTTGIFHGDEVWENADKENWTGLFFSNKDFYLATTSISMESVHDPVLDENENEKTGWEVKSSNKDTSIILFATPDTINKRQVNAATLSKNQIYPNNTITFNYSGIQYSLFATGTTKKSQYNSEDIEVSNYRLYLKAIKGGKVITELLVAQPSFDDNMITILFAGDIDGDNLLDLIIDTSYHYNAMAPTLYLSKGAGKNQLLIVVGRHVSVGC